MKTYININNYGYFYLLSIKSILDLLFTKKEEYLVGFYKESKFGEFEICPDDIFSLNLRGFIDNKLVHILNFSCKDSTQDLLTRSYLDSLNEFDYKYVVYLNKVYTEYEIFSFDKKENNITMNQILQLKKRFKSLRFKFHQAYFKKNK